MKPLETVILMCLFSGSYCNWDICKRMIELDISVTDSLLKPVYENEGQTLINILEFTGHLLHMFHLFTEKEELAYENFFKLLKHSDFKRPSLMGTTKNYILLRPNFKWEHDDLLEFLEIVDSAKSIWIQLNETFSDTFEDFLNIPMVYRGSNYFYRHT